MKNYKKKFITTITTTLCILIFILIVNLVITEKIAGKHYLQTIESTTNNRWYNYKINAAKKIKEPKIVFISGSNTIFGIDAKNIEEALNKPVINFGMHAGLQEHIFYASKEILKPYDTVVLPLEFVLYSRNSIPSAMAEYIISYDKNFYDTLTFYQKFQISFYLPKLIYSKIIDSQKIKFATKKKLKTNSYYNFKFNNNGDVILGDYLDKCNKKQSNKNIKELSFDKSNALNTNAIKEFIKWCKENNITVYGMPPCCLHKKEISIKEKKFLTKIKKFYAENDVKFLGEFEDCFYEKQDMLDTVYHLNPKGKEKRTKYIIELLKKELDY